MRRARPAEAKRPDETQLRESVQRVVDGSEAHRRERGTEPLEQLLRRRMCAVVRELAHTRFEIGKLLPRERAKLGFGRRILHQLPVLAHVAEQNTVSLVVRDDRPQAP